MAGRRTADAISRSSPPPQDPFPLVSSPPSISHASENSSAKERRNPSITPRKFRRFFTPRNNRVPSHMSPARQALRDLATPHVNSRHPYQMETPAPSSPLQPVVEEDLSQLKDTAFASTPRNKRRKIQHQTPDSSPCRPPQLASCDRGPSSHGTASKPALLSPIGSSRSVHDLLLGDEADTDDDELPTISRPVKRLVPLPARGHSGQLLQRRLGDMPRPGRSYMSFPTADWRVETADFHSRPSDAHHCSSHDGPGRCIAFCTAACRTNSLVAVGDEEGRVRLLDSSGDSASPFSDIHLSFQAHGNAVIDLDFSRDDHLLATASGDQTGRVIDMMTQSPTALLHHHTASLKQVRFQPGKANNSVLATSSRDGSIQIWDLRCTGAPVQEVLATEERETGLRYGRPRPKQGTTVNSIRDAHTRAKIQGQQAHTVGAGDTPSHKEHPGRIGDVSVTALQFLPEGNEHILLSACEADATVKVWDIRSIQPRHKSATPLSVTAPPTSHSRWRPFGISSLALGGDASRLYAVCKDNTVYAYSTAHLILGHAPELASRNGEPQRRRHGAVQQGLGPMYGFRNPSFHAASFYVKSQVRPASDGRTELLAVGSSDSCAVLFPTAERYFREDLAGTMSSLSLENSTMSNTKSAASAGTRRTLFRSASNSNLAARVQDDIPIYNTGTPLIRGHEREVGALTWTGEGKLVTVSDDFMVRCWGEDRAEASDLRKGGETGGRRWGCGWADVGEDWDASDDETDEED